MAEGSSSSHDTHHTVFVDTNLDTHLVMVVTDHDTVADFKQKVSLEHCNCFPDIGQISVHSLKVKCNDHFYHLINSMPVKSAFDGVEQSWFIHVDASTSCGKAIVNSKNDPSNIHQNLSEDVDVKILPQQTPKFLGALMEKGLHNLVNNVREGNSIPCSALGRPHEMSAAVGDGDLDSLQDLDMGGASGSKLEGRVDASENTSAFEGKKRKRKRKKTQSDQPENATETEVNMEDVGFSSPLVTSSVMETDDPGNKRRKKAKKSEVADAKIHAHANNAEDVVPLTSDRKKTFEDDLGTKNESILFRTEDRQLSKVCSVDNDKIEEKSVLQNEGPNMIHEAKSTMLNIKDRDVSAVDASVSTEVRNLSDKTRKKSKKTKAADSHASGAKDTVPPTAEQKSSFDGDLGTKKESILTQTENIQPSKVCSIDNGKIEEKPMLENENCKLVPEANGTVSSIKFSALDAAISTEVQNPTVQKRKKSKKGKASNAERKVSTSGAEHVESLENAVQSISKSQRPSMQDSGTETNEGDKVLSRNEDEEVAKLESPRGRGFHDKDCQGDGHEGASLQLGSTDDIDEKVNHKASKPSVSSSNTVKDPGMMKQVVHTENPSLSAKGKKEEEKTSKRMRKSKLKIDNSVKELCNIGPKPETVGEFEAKSLQQQQMSGHVASPQLPSSAINCSVAEQHLVDENRDEANDADEVNFRNYFVAKNVSQVIAPAKELVEKDAQQTQHDKKLKSNKKAKPCIVNSLGTPSNLEKPHAEIVNQGHKKKTVSADPNTSQLQTSNSEPHSNDSNLSIAKESVDTPLNANNKVKAFPIKVSRDKIVDSSREFKSPHEVQFQSSSGVDAHTSLKVNSEAAKNSCVEKTGDVVSGSQNQKSLLDVPKKVYSGSSTESYEDKGDQKQDSDASTMSPLDASFSSGHSDGESEVNPKSPGSSGRNVLENGANRSAKSQTALKSMDLHSILRSSKSYKKAKLSASQSQPDDEEL